VIKADRGEMIDAEGKVKDLHREDGGTAEENLRRRGRLPHRAYRKAKALS
jgi:hypothetical protein